MEPAKKMHFCILYRRNRDDADGQLSLKLAKHLKELLEDKDRGRVGYYADDDAPIGSDIIEECFKAINLSHFIIVILSPKFVQGNWTNFLQKAAFRTLAESCDRNAFSRFLPIALGIDKRTVEEFCPHLCTKEVLYVPENFLEDKSWEDRLCKVQDLKHPILCALPGECGNATIAGLEPVINDQPHVPQLLQTMLATTVAIQPYKAPGEHPGSILQIYPRYPQACERLKNTKHDTHTNETVHKLSSDSHFHIEKASPRISEGCPTMSGNYSVESQHLEAAQSASTLTGGGTGQQLLPYNAARSTWMNADVSKPIRETSMPSMATLQMLCESMVSMHCKIDQIGPVLQENLHGINYLKTRMTTLEDEVRKTGDTVSSRVTDELNSLKDLVQKQDKKITKLQTEVLDLKSGATGISCNLVEKEDGTPAEHTIQRF